MVHSPYGIMMRILHSALPTTVIRDSSLEIYLKKVCPNRGHRQAEVLQHLRNAS
jgi:hypothetical protein